MITPVQHYWWEDDTKRVHETIFSIIKYLEQNQNQTHEMNLRHMRLYSNINILGLSIYSYGRTEGSKYNFDRLTYNIVQSCIDTVTQKIAKNKVKPMFLTEGGNWSMQRKAQKLGEFVQGQFYSSNVYETTPLVFRDAAIFGTGAVKIYRDGSDIICERIFTDEIKVEYSDGVYAKPKSIYQCKAMPRETMLRMYPSYAQQIKLCARLESSQTFHNSLSDVIQVVEAWHLPTKEGKGGRHVITIENATLVDEEYTKSYFPFAFLRWKQRPIGFFGQGLAEELMGIQIEANKILRIIERSFHMAVPKMMVENGSQVSLAQLNNEVAGILKYSGVKPEWVSFPPVNPQYFQHLQNLIDYGYRQAGISQMSASSAKPAGLNSGKALREFNDIESERFILNGQAWEQFHLDIAEQFIECARDIALEDPDYAVKSKTSDFMKTIKWAEVDMDKDKYVMQAFPTSFLSSTPSAKFQDIQEMLQAGMIDKEFALQLLDYPDVKAYSKYKTADITDIMKTCEYIIDEGSYAAPEPFQNLELGIKYIGAQYLVAKNDNVPESRLELLRRWISEAQGMLQSMNPPAPEMAPQGPAPQLGKPAPAPVSELLPNAPAPVM